MTGYLRIVLVGGVLALVGWLADPLERDCDAPPAGGVVLGGLQGAVANGFFLKGVLRWEGRDLVGAERSFARAVAADPTKWFFWRHAARLFAFDAPRAEMRARAAAGERIGEAEMREMRQRHAERALAWLHAAERVHPADPRVEIERGMILLHALEDRRAAADAFGRAWEAPGGPLFAARLRGALLAEAGETAAAHAWYGRWLQGLDPAARAEQAAIVLPRLRELEERLGIPPERRLLLP